MTDEVPALLARIAEAAPARGLAWTAAPDRARAEETGPRSRHPDGYLELRDRLKDVIISGGENIATIEVEQVLSAHPAVSEVAVVGRPDERWGEVPVAYVTLARTAAGLDVGELREFARERMAHFKVPKQVIVVDDLPKTATGKIQKFALRQQQDGRPETERA